MNPKTIVTAALLAFVAISVRYLVVTETRTAIDTPVGTGEGLAADARDAGEHAAACPASVGTGQAGRQRGDDLLVARILERTHASKSCGLPAGTSHVRGVRHIGRRGVAAADRRGQALRAGTRSRRPAAAADSGVQPRPAMSAGPVRLGQRTSCVDFRSDVLIVPLTPAARQSAARHSQRNSGSLGCLDG